MNTLISQLSDHPSSFAGLGKPLLGISTLVRMFYVKSDVTPVWNSLMERVTAAPEDISALLDMSLLLQSTGPKGLEIQAAALKMQSLYHRIHGNGRGLRVLAFMTGGDMAANTPVDFLLEGSDMVLYQLYIDADTPHLPPLPEFDVAFMAIGECPANVKTLENMARLLADWSGPPVLNAEPLRIRDITRDYLYNALSDEPSILSPRLVRTRHADLVAIVEQDEDLFGLTFPLIIRPAGTHAGDRMEKIESVADLEAYLQTSPNPDYYLSQFIPYAGADGLYRKLRIAFINGLPFASHLCVSENWMVHFLSASMDIHADRRAEEAHWMQTFDTDFVPRHRAAFAALNRCFDMNYFVIDCVGLPDGRLMVFEADVIMIVHDMDLEDLFAYKKPVMHKLFRAFQAILQEAATAHQIKPDMLRIKQA
eukprot:gene19468-19891_t